MLQSPNNNSTQIGPFTLYAIETGRFKLDGGAMFGIVPKPLWSKQIEPDEKNRITLAMRCLLIKSQNTGRIYLIDNGIGDKFPDKFRKIYGVDHEHSNLTDSLAAHGFKPEDVTDLIFTHLHFDHCGGTTYYSHDGELHHRFSNARYHVISRQLKHALTPNAREKATMLPENVRPISEWPYLNDIGDNETYEFEPGITNFVINGHTSGHQCIKVSHKNTTLVFAADLLPTAIHVPLPWIMAFDIQPIITLSEREIYFNRAVEEGWFLFLEHDADTEMIQLTRSEDGYKISRKLKLQEL